MRTDVLTALCQLEGRKYFDIVFMDPPYGKELEKEVLTYLATSKLIDEDSLIIVEMSDRTTFDYIHELGFTVEKLKKYKTNMHLFLKRAGMKRAIYPGSFDPVTNGHVDIILRSSKIVDKLIVGVLNNSAKKSLFSVEERVSMLKELTKDLPNVEVTSFDGLLVDYMREIDASIIVRGLRAVTDFEYELQIAQTNHIENTDIETIFLTTNLQYSYLSSTIVKEFASYGGDISKFVPEQFVDRIYEKYNIKK